jgi:3-deoxy-D-manno-octulosonate 8-phosphate phosphatase (KDO 8-P phosphatase)
LNSVLIRAIALDVDGVLTDGRFWWGTDNEEYKQFSFRDVMGISIGINAGLRFALISGEASLLVDRFATKMGIEAVFKGCKDKGSAIRAYARNENLDLSSVCFMGDDVNDLPAMRLAGLSAAPADAVSHVLNEAAFVSKYPGGRGAVRELIDVIVKQNGML